jgi:RNA polymerase sigma factor (sigma-70 family)
MPKPAVNLSSDSIAFTVGGVSAVERSEEDATHSHGSQSDEALFSQLVRCHGPALARYVRFRIAHPSDAEDVLQETLIAVWLGFRRLRDPARMQAWLMHVAQNRCRDYFRVRERREFPLDEEALQIHADRFGLHQYRRTKTLVDVMDALDAAPPAARETARRFYLEGLSIAEIATLSQIPTGTVKRQLFQARHAARIFLGLTNPAQKTHTEENTMPTLNAPENPTEFPAVRPEIKITETDETPFTVDCQELCSWSIIPQVGEQASTADYSLPGWKLDEVSTLRALRPGSVHHVEGVEIEMRVWKPASGWQRPGTIYARLTDEKVEYLAVHLPHEEFTQIETFLDDTFPWNWGTLDRSISDQGLFRCLPDGSVALDKSVPHGRAKASSFGVVELEVGRRQFTCLRVLELPDDAGDLSETGDYATESFLTQQGHTILVRRFCPPRFVEAAEFPVVLDVANQLVIDGVPFVHWYDTITQAAL